MTDDNDDNELDELIVRELDKVVTCEGGEDEQPSLSTREDTVSDDIPLSLLRYFETSKCRAALCEELILEELHGEAETDECKTPWREKHVEVEARSPKSSETEEEVKKQSQINFQEELKKILEAEKRHQKELEVMEKRAQEKLEQEFQLQQELIRDLQRQVDEERKKVVAAHKRIKEEDEKKRKEMEEKMKKEEEERRKREAEKNEREMQKMEEEARKKKKKKEEDRKRKIEEMRLKEKLRREEDDQRRREEEEEERRRVENKGKGERGKEKEEEMNIKGIRCKDEKTEEEEMKRKEGNEKIEEMKGKYEEDKTGFVENVTEEEKRRRTSEDIGLKEWREKEDAEDKRSEEERRMTMEHEVRKKNEIRDLQKQEKKGKKVREEEEDIVNVEGERKKKDEEEKRKKEEDQRRTTEEEMNQREIEMVEERIREEEEETKREVEKNMIQKDMRKKEEERNRKREGEETENFREEDGRRNTDGETEVKRWEKKKNSDDEKKRRGEEQRMAKEAEVWMKKENVETEEMQLTDENTRKREEVEKRRSVECKDDKNEEEEEEKQWGEKELRPEKERDVCHERKTEDKGKKQREEQKTKTGEGGQLKEEKEREEDDMKTQNTRESLTLQVENSSSPTSSRPGPSQTQSTSSPRSSETTSAQQDQHCAAVTSHASSRLCLPEHTEQKRLSWMKECMSWSKLSLQNKNKQRRSRGGGGGVSCSRRRANRTSEGDGVLSPVCPHTVLMSTGCEALQQVTTVTLEDLPGCSLSTLAQCPHIQSLTVRRCGLKSLEGLNHLPNLCSIDVQENDISFVDCGNMTSLRVLRLGRNKLTYVHGLSGAENLDVLDLSHNLITRIAGLESARRLQSLSLGHNQLISTKGLRDVSTLLHLDCSHNHLAVVEGLENNALLHTLDLKSNNITEPPSLINHVLLRELHLDDNSVSSLQSLAVCWLPLMQRLSAAQNRITVLPSMSDFVSLANLDLRFNCISELRDVCESVSGCRFLRELQLTGNPLQHESNWRSMLHRAVPGLRSIDGMETDSLLSAPAVPQVSLASGGDDSGCEFLTFCQAQLKQTGDLQQQQHRRELSNASSPLDAVKCSCRHFTETLTLAVEQRFAHEYGDSTVYSIVPADKSATEMSFHSSTTHEKPTSFHLEMAPESDHHALDSKNTAAALIQQQWRKYREKCGNVSHHRRRRRPPTAEKGGGGVGDRGKPDVGSFSVDRSVIEQDYAATAIQAFWRGFALRRRLASALAVVTWPDSGEDETFEDVDVDGFVFDEAAEEERWTLALPEDSSSSGHHRVSEQLLSLKPLGPSLSPVHYATPSIPVWRPKQAWVAGEQVEPTEERTSPESSNRLKSAAASVLSGLSAKSEKIVEEWGFKDSNTALLMLKRAQKMRTNKKQHQKIHQDPFVCQQGPGETRNRPAPHRRNHMRVSAAEQQAKQMERVKQERAQQWLRLQADRDPESERFLPEISSDILNGGRVQLVADPGYSEHLHHTSGLWVGSSSAAQLSKERNYPRRNSTASRPTGKELPSPQRADSAPVKKERVSFRDSPVQLSGGWGGGKKRGQGSSAQAVVKPKSSVLPQGGRLIGQAPYRGPQVEATAPLICSLCHSRPVQHVDEDGASR